MSTDLRLDIFVADAEFLDRLTAVSNAELFPRAFVQEEFDQAKMMAK